MQPVAGDITTLLRKWSKGEASALDELVPLVYPHLRQVAAGYMRREQNSDLLQPTILVHELYLRLLKQKEPGWEDRSHFYTFCARIMRMILIDQARSNHAQMRGAGLSRVPLNDDLAWVQIDSPELLDLDRALNELKELDPDLVQLVELRYFLGCTAEETASVLNISKATVDREFKFVKTWLLQRIHPPKPVVRTSA
jgi:RNA polymerase sigma factor (TIGR02999 family)